MAVAHRASTASNSSAGTTALTATIPGTIATDDVCFLLLTSAGATTQTPTVSDNDSGGNAWAKIASGPTSQAATLWYKRATSASANKSITASSCIGSCAAVFSGYSGATTKAIPYDSLTAEDNASGNETHAAITPENPNSFICLGISNLGNDNAVATQSTTDPGALTERAENLSTGGSDSAAVIASALQGARNTTGALTWAQTNGVTISFAWAIAPPNSIGSSTPTEGTDTLSSAVAVGPVVGTGTIRGLDDDLDGYVPGVSPGNEQADTLNAAATVTAGSPAGGIAGTLEVTEGQDSLASTAVSGVAGTASLTEAADIPVSTALSGTAITSAPTEAADSLASTSLSGTVAASNTAETADTLSGQATAPLAATGNPSAADDIVSSLAASGAAVDLSGTEASDTVLGQAGAAQSFVYSDLAIAEASDTLSGMAVSGVAANFASGTIDDSLVGEAESGGETTVVAPVAVVAGGRRSKRRWILPNGMQFYGTEAEVAGLLQRKVPAPDKPKQVKPQKVYTDQPAVEYETLQSPKALRTEIPEQSFNRQPPVVWPSKVPWPERYTDVRVDEDSDVCLGGGSTHWDAFNFDGIPDDGGDSLQAVGEAGFWFPRKPRYQQEIILVIDEDTLEELIGS